MRVLLGGGTGFIGRHVRLLLLEKGHTVTVVSRTPGKDIITWDTLEESGLPTDVQAVVSLSGENILNPLKRWTEDFKRDVWSSRVRTTTILKNAILKADHPPGVFVSTSGVGYYKPDPVVAYTEDSPGGDHDYLSRLCAAWEDAAALPDGTKTRRVVIRTGVVLGKDGGMIQQAYWPFYFNFGGRISSGKQWFPWIHIRDISRLFVCAIEDERMNDVINGVAPQSITNEKFTKTLALSMNRFAVVPLPGFLVNCIFGQERGKVITEGQKVIPEKTLKNGFDFSFPNIESACREIVG